MIGTDRVHPHHLIGVDMKGYIDLILGGLPKTMDGDAVTPATSNLFQTNNDGVPLSKEDKDFYHHVTMQLFGPRISLGRF